LIPCPKKVVQRRATIVDANSAPVEGATVYGTFSGATSDSVSGVTGADGQMTLTSSNKKDGGTWQFCVDDVVKSGWTYDSEANVETCDYITAGTVGIWTEGAGS
jgi:hypothetical protein